MKKIIVLALSIIMLLSVGCSAAVSVVGANINEDGHLVLSMSDGSTIDAGYAKGEKGDKGDIGPQGPQGIQGPQGEVGPQGERGPQGEKGDTGAAGRDGVDGRDGIDGKDGASGVAGQTPYIGDNGNWWIGNEDTGVKAGSNDFIYNDDGNGTVLIAYVGSDYHVKLPEKTTEVGYRAFENNLIIISITFNDAVTKINDMAFSGCSNLKEIYCSESLQEIGDYAFENCRDLTSIYLSESLQEIGYGAFNGCYLLTSIELPASLQIMSTGTFFQTGLKSITCKAITPPKALNRSFGGIEDRLSFTNWPVVVYVPAASVEAYKASKTWAYVTVTSIEAIS